MMMNFSFNQNDCYTIVNVATNLILVFYLGNGESLTRCSRQIPLQLLGSLPRLHPPGSGRLSPSYVGLSDALSLLLHFQPIIWKIKKNIEYSNFYNYEFF